MVLYHRIRLERLDINLGLTFFNWCVVKAKKWS